MNSLRQTGYLHTLIKLGVNPGPAAHSLPRRIMAPIMKWVLPVGLVAGAGTALNKSNKNPQSDELRYLEENYYGQPL